MANVSEILRNEQLLAGINANWRSYFQDIADYCLPRKGWITTVKTKGERVNFNWLYDSTAIRSLKVMAAGFHSNLTNPSSQWFGLTSKDLKLMEQKEVSTWFNDVTAIMTQMLNLSNFDTSMQEFYMDYGGFGTGTLLSLEDKKTDVRFLTIPIEEINIEEDAYGRVCGVYRNFKLSVMQAYMMWGDDAGPEVKKKYEDKKYFEQCEFLHYCGPRERREVDKIDALNMPIQSVWIAKKDQHEILESGFTELPYHVGRFWKDNNESFGYAPSMDVLADIKLVNAMMKTLLRSAMKQTDPPMQMPAKGYMLPLNLNPAAMNYRDANTAADSLQAIDIKGNLPITLEIMERIQKNIEEGFFVPLFRALSQIDKQMTVPEVQRRIMENMVLLGPVVGRATHETLDPMIIRVFNIGFKKGKFPEPPQVLQGQEWGPVYLSPLARAQRDSELTNIEQFLGRVQAIAAVKPGVLDMIDEDKTVDIIAQIQRINPQMLKDPKQVEALRDARAKMQQMQAQMDIAHKGAAIAKTGAEAESTAASAKVA